jgi:uncharacterized protein
MKVTIEGLNMSDVLLRFAKAKCINFETFRENAGPVKTPVWFVVSSGTLFVSTELNSGKVKRIRRSSKARMVSSTMGGEPKGEWIDAKVRFADLGESKRVVSMMNRKYNILKWVHDIYNWIRRRKIIILAITPLVVVDS